MRNIQMSSLITSLLFIIIILRLHTGISHPSGLNRQDSHAVLPKLLVKASPSGLQSLVQPEESLHPSQDTFAKGRRKSRGIGTTFNRSSWNGAWR